MSVTKAMPLTPLRAADLMSFQMGLEKVGGLAEDIGRAALHVGITTGVGLGLNAAVHAGGKLVDAATFERDLKNLIAHYPELSHADPKVLRAAYTSLRKLNPEFAKDPLVGGSLVQALLRNVPHDNPRGMPRFDLSTAQVLNQANAQRRGGLAEDLIKANTTEAGKVVSRMREMGENRRMTLADRATDREHRLSDVAAERAHRSQEKATERALLQQQEADLAASNRALAARALARVLQNHTPAGMPQDQDDFERAAARKVYERHYQP